MVSLVCLCATASRRAFRALRAVLRGAGFDVHLTCTAEEAIDRAVLSTPEPRSSRCCCPMATAWMCRQITAWGSPALIVLSAVDDGDQKVLALEAGADEYVLKPFAPRELVARLQAILRRATRGGDETVLECGDVRIELVARVVRSQGREVRLRPIEFRLLQALLRIADGSSPHIHTYPGAGYLFEGRNGKLSTPRARRVPLSEPQVVVALDNPEYPRSDVDKVPAPRRISDVGYRPAA